MKHIYDKHKLAKQLTIDDILIEHKLSHKRYRNWLYRNHLPMYPLTKGLYDEAILSENPKQEFKLTRSEAHKVLYSSSWVEPRECRKEEIASMLENNPNLSQEYIAYKLGITQARVSQVARQYNLRPQRKRRAVVTKEQVAELSHLSAHEIAEKLNISLSTVYKKLCKNT